jgi:hypothetical protein
VAKSIGICVKERLASLYGEENVAPVWTALVEINNEIGYEEK